MMHETIETPTATGGKPPPVPHGLLPASTFPFSGEPAAVDCTPSISRLVELRRRETRVSRRGEPTNGAYALQLLRRAVAQGDQEARTAFEQRFGEIVHGWLHNHPSRDVAWSFESEEYYITQAFERFWQTAVQQQVAFKTLAGALVYLRASLNGAILAMLRAHARPEAVPRMAPAEPLMQDRADPKALWEILQRMLPSAREQRLAYLLYHCGLEPREIVRRCPHEWNDVQEISRLRQSILERLLCYADQLP